MNAMSKSIVAIASMLLVMSVFAAELLPFPENAQQQGQFVEQSVLAKFKDRISKIDCKELIELRDGLARRRSDSTTTADFNYYHNRWKVAVSVIKERSCE
jgi:hypothetical protein